MPKIGNPRPEEKPLPALGVDPWSAEQQAQTLAGLTEMRDALEGAKMQQTVIEVHTRSYRRFASCVVTWVGQTTVQLRDTTVGRDYTVAVVAIESVGW